MRLITSKVRAKGAQAANEIKPLKISFNVTAADPKELKGLKAGKKLYIYIGERGDLQPLAAIFADNADASLYQYKDDGVFKDKAEYLVTVSSDVDLSSLRGSRIEPTYLEIKKADTKGDRFVVQGMLHNAYDPRLAHLRTTEATEFGEGTFKLDDMIALYDGSYFHLSMSPMADSIEKVAKEQRELFQKHADDEGDANIKRKLDATANLLKSHAYEIYKVEDDIAYFINGSGKWQAINLAGNRKLDLWDKERILEHADASKLDATEARKQKDTFHKRPMYDRFDLADTVNLMFDEVDATREQDKASLQSVIDASANIKPSDGLEPIPGLKEGVEFPPHQAYLIAKLKNRDRLPVDAAAGAGKTPIIIADILNQISAGKIKRPLVITKNDGLLTQFASEIRNFSDLNPWIINTDAIKKWKEGDIDKFLEDAKGTPPNTVFLTSYHWLAREKSLKENGQTVRNNGKLSYGTMKTFPRSYRLLKEIGIDAVFADEVHALKNDSNATQAASVFSKVSQVKGFTGTLMPGNLIDALGSTGFIHSALLGSAKEFVAKYSPTNSPNSYHDSAPKDIRAKLQRFGTPQVRESAWASMMPKVHRSYHYVDFNATQQKAYESLLQNTIEDIEKDPKLKRLFDKFRLELEEDEKVIHPLLLARFTPLEVFLNAPAEAKDYLKAILTEDDAKSPKLKAISDIVSKHLADTNNGKVIIFTQYKESAKSIVDSLAPNLKEQAAYYHGGMVDVLSRFKNPDSNLKILVAVDRTIRAGQNLQVANCIIHADTLWLSGDMDQRQKRSERLKQTREVFIHHVVVHNSHELLKNARVLSQEHMISKANSDFEDKTVLPHVEMTLKGMKSFRSVEKLEPFIERQKVLGEFKQKTSEKEKDFFGSRLMKPIRYEPLKEGTKLAVVPSATDFEGNLNDASYAIEEELDKLPWESEPPKLLKFNLQNWDEHWFLTCFRSADPQGFVRRLGFQLQPPYMYLEVPSKGGMAAIIKDIEKEDIEILNKENLEQGIAKARMLQSGRKGFLKELEQKGKRSVAAATAVKYQMEFHFATIDNYPFVMTDNLRLGSKEAQLLKKQDFKEGISFWYLPITRSKLVSLLKRLMHSHQGIKIADWGAFQELAHKIFGIDLKEFEDLGEKQ